MNRFKNWSIVIYHNLLFTAIDAIPACRSAIGCRLRPDWPLTGPKLFFSHIKSIDLLVAPPSSREELVWEEFLTTKISYKLTNLCHCVTPL